MIRINNIKLRITQSSDDLMGVAAKQLRVAKQQIKELSILKQSVDARDKGDIRHVYAIAITLQGDEKAAVERAKSKDVLWVQPQPPLEIPHLAPPAVRPVVVGLGPAGLFAALHLARAGLRPIVLERGNDVDRRRQDVQAFWQGGSFNAASNVQFGEGGAGTFSDGKLTSGISSPLCAHVLEAMVQHGAPDEILYQAKPHIGTDNLAVMVRGLREDIVKLGGEVRFASRLCDIEMEDGAVCAIAVEAQDAIYKLPCKTLVLACGHSARDTFALVRDRGADMVRKPFSIGARIEHKQEMVSKAQYGPSFKLLGAADYKLSCHLPGGRSAYTFCMCPGGQVVAASSEAGGVVTNGMSAFARDGENANAALLVNVNPEDFDGEDVLAGVEFQRKYERLAFEAGGRSYRAPAQILGDFMDGRASSTLGSVTPSYSPGIALANLADCLPDFAVTSMRQSVRMFDRRLRGFGDENAVLTGVETRSSSPVRMLRGQDFQSNLRGLYPCGEGAGYAGGIMSAAVDGLRCAIAACQGM